MGVMTLVNSYISALGNKLKAKTGQNKAN